MADVTVAQFADVLKVPVDRLLVQVGRARVEVLNKYLGRVVFPARTVVALQPAPWWAASSAAERRVRSSAA